jgi:hypothetical protein
MESEPEPEQESEPELVVESEPEVEKETELESEPEQEPEPEAESDAEPEPESDVESEPELVAESEPESISEEESAEGEEDINDLLDMLTKDFEEEVGNGGESDTDAANDDGTKIEDTPVAMEASLFSEDESEDFFADGMADEESAVADGATMDDVFQDALSAVAYSSEDEGQTESDEGYSPEAFSSEEDDVLMALDSMDGEEEMPSLGEEPVQTVPLEKPKQKKVKKPKTKVSFWKRIFGNIITDETAELEAQERAAELAGEEEKVKLKEEKKQQLEAQKTEKAEQAKAEKERKAAEKAEKAERAQAEKEEKKRIKMEREANEVVGKINPVGATIVMVFFGVICLLIILGTQTFSYSRAVSTAEDSFMSGDYEDAYDSIAGVNVSESSQEMADKVRICMQLQREVNSYNNYYKMKMYLEALDSLMKGIRSYDTNKEKADTYGILNQYNELEKQIADILKSEFGVTEEQARNINNIEKRETYTEKLEDIVKKWSVKMKADER